MSFWSASTPRRYHEMEAGTVPATVIAAYRRAGVSSDGAVKWGVAIPAGMAGQLDRYLAEFSGGSLVIGIDGAVRRED